MTEVTLLLTGACALLLWGNVQNLLLERSRRKKEWRPEFKLENFIPQEIPWKDDGFGNVTRIEPLSYSEHDRIMEYIIRQADPSWSLGDPRDHINLVAGPDGHIIRAEPL